MKRLAFALALLTSPAAAQECYTAVNIGSKHINATREFNEFNPGIGLGCAWGGPRFQYGLEAGVALNSYSDWSTYAAGFARVRLASFENVNLWGGGFVGFAGYPNLINYAKRHGIPTLGDSHIMVAGITGMVEFERFSVAINYIPFGAKMDGVAILKFQIPYGGE